MNARDNAIEAVHSRICEEPLAEHMDPMWPGRCVKAVQAAAPHLLAARAGAAEATVRRVRDLIDATEPNRYAILSMEGLRIGIRSALGDCPPRTEGAKPHCPDCSGIVGETGIVW